MVLKRWMMGWAALLLTAAVAGMAPAMAKPAAEIDIPFTQFTLANGLRVVVHEDRKAPIVAVSVWYHVGSKDEPEGKTGFAHLFEHLMFNGSENYDGEYFAPLEEVGATSLNGTTWFDRTNYFQNVPTPALERVLWLESDRMGHLLGAVTQEKLDNQRGVVQNEKRQGDNQPYGLVEYHMLEGLFPPGHPYRHSTIGSMEDLNAATLDDVHDWFKRYYGPNNAVLVLAGDIDAETARPLVEKYFGDIPPGPPLARMTQWVPIRPANTTEAMTDRVPNARVYRSWTVPPRNHREAYLLHLAAKVLADGKTAPFYHDLVYDKRLATAVSVSVEPHQLASMFQIEIDVAPGVAPEDVIARLDALLADFLEQGPSADELARAAIGIEAGVVRGLEQVGGFGGKAVTLAEGALYADDPAFFKTALGWIREAKRRDVRDAARQWLRHGYHQITVRPHGDLAAAGAGADRSQIPAVTATPDLVFPAIERAQLSNGIPVVLARRDAVPVVEVAVQFNAGFAADHGGKLGTASLALAMLDEGTTSRNLQEISVEQQRLGAEIGAGSTLDTSQVMLSALKRNLKPSLALFADIVRNPAFEVSEQQRLQDLRLAQIAQEMARPVSLALRELPPLIYGEGHAYAMPFTGSGTPESVQAITHRDLVDFQARWLRPDNAEIFVVGDTSLDEIMPLLEANFGDWQAPAVPLGHKPMRDAALASQPRLVLIDRPGSPQSLILAAHLAPPTAADNNIAIEAMNDILGGQFTARVNMNLREDKGWAYGAFTYLQPARGQRPFLVYAPVETERTADSIAELIRELEAYKGDRPATEAELRRVIDNAVRGLPGRFETAGAVLQAFLTNARYDRPMDYYAGLTEAYRALDLDAVRAAADQVVQPNALTWLVIGDRAKIEQPLRDLGIAEVEIRSLD